MPVHDSLGRLIRQVRSLAPDSPQLISVVSEFRTLAEEFAGMVRRPHEMKPPRGSKLALAHYTSLETAYKVVSSGPDAGLRLYDSVHVNDRKKALAALKVRNCPGNLLRCVYPRKTVISSSSNLAARFSTAYILSFVAMKQTEIPVMTSVSGVPTVVTDAAVHSLSPVFFGMVCQLDCGS